MKTLSALVALACLLMPLRAQQPNLIITQTSTSYGLSLTDKQISFTGLMPDIPSNAQPLVVLVDSEAMLIIESVSPGALNTGTVKRGYLGTAKATHFSGALAYIGIPSQFGTADRSGACQLPPNSPQFINVVDQILWSCVAGTWAGVNTGIADILPFTFVPFAASLGGVVDAGITRSSANTFDFGNGTPGDHSAALLAGSLATSGNASVGGTLNVTGASTTANINSSGNVTAIGLFGNLLTANSFTIGGAGVSAFSSISLITPTITGPTDMFSVRINTCPITLEYGNGSIPLLQGIVGCTKAPDNSNLGGVSTGGSFYSFGGGGTANTPAVGAFTFGAPGAATNVGAWSFNGAATNALNGTGAGVPVALFGAELDINTASSGSAPFLAHGLAVVSAATQVPTNAFDALDCRISIGISLPFNQCLTSEPGAATEGLRFWPLASTASNSASQPIVLVARNSAGDYSTSKFYLDAAGSFQFFTGGGNFTLNPAVGVVTNSPSPELIFSSYSSGSVLQQGGMFLDSFGNMNIVPSTTAFSSTQLKNGSGVTVAEVDTAAFKMNPRLNTSDPGCSAVGQLGTFWISDDGSSTVNKVCNRTSGTFSWHTF